jgi:hypothetical protein
VGVEARKLKQLTVLIRISRSLLDRIYIRFFHFGNFARKLSGSRCIFKSTVVNGTVHYDLFTQNKPEVFKFELPYIISIYHSTN